ncbi:unnamed protein product [Auanema sp. JU1783]|nr:unnamed protein product [Auanema sp. JU1783]
MYLYMVSMFVLITSSISFKIEELKTYSARSTIERLFQYTNSSRGLILEFPSDNKSLESLSSYLYSTDHDVFINLLQRVSHSCDSEDVGSCPEKDKLISSYIKYELRQLKQLDSFLESAKFVKCFTTSDKTENNLEISILINILLSGLSLALISKVYFRIKLRITLLVIISAANFVITYGRMYQEQLAKRVSSVNLSDACLSNSAISYLVDLVRSLFYLENKTTCQKFIEVHSLPVWLDISPSLVLMEVLSNFVFGWLGPFGYHLNLFYKRCFSGLSLFHIIPISLFPTLAFLVLTWCGKKNQRNKEVTLPKAVCRRSSRKRSCSRLSVRGPQT